MNKTIVQNEGAAALTVAGPQHGRTPATIKLGLDIHARLYVVVAQDDHALPKPPRRLEPPQFVPWVESLLAAGHQVHVVDEACGFGFGLYRQLVAAGAHCYVIAPRKLDEQRTGVKTDPRDASTLCQRLSRYVDGNTRELVLARPPASLVPSASSAVIRVPSEQEERARHTSRQREQLVRARKRMQAQGRGLLVGHGLPAPANWARPSANLPSPLRRLGGSRRLGAACSSLCRRGWSRTWNSIGRSCSSSTCRSPS